MTTGQGPQLMHGTGAMLVGCGCPSEGWVSGEVWSLAVPVAVPSYVKSGLHRLSAPPSSISEPLP